MELLKKYYIYIFEFIIGNFIFNFIYSIEKEKIEADEFEAIFGQ